MAENTTRPKRPAPTLAALAARVDTLEAENRDLTRAVERLAGRLDEQREWFREAMDERAARIEALLFNDVRRREKRAREQVLPWLEEHSGLIRQLAEHGEAFRKSIAALDEGARARTGGSGRPSGEPRTPRRWPGGRWSNSNRNSAPVAGISWGRSTTSSTTGWASSNSSRRN